MHKILTWGIFRALTDEAETFKGYLHKYYGLCSGVATGGFRGLEPPIELQMTSYIIETVRTKCIIGEALKVRGQRHDKLCLGIVQQALKWSLQYANFQKFFGKACPRTPIQSFLALKMLKINSAGKKTFEKSDEN